MSKVPRPPYMEHFQARINAVAGKNCAEMKRVIKGTGWHTEQGTFLGTITHFDNPDNGALTDFQIGCSFDKIYDGVIMRFIEPDQGVAPYANGRIDEVVPAYGDGKKFIDTYVRPTGNLEELNARTRSIECSDNGNPNIDRGNELNQIESLAFLTAYIHNVEASPQQDAATFTANLHGEQYLHAETGTSHQLCPGPWIKANKTKIRSRAADIIYAFEHDTPLLHPLLVTYPPGWSGPSIMQPGSNVNYAKPDTTLGRALGDKHCINFNGGIIVRFRDWVRFEKPITPHKYATEGSARLGPDKTGSLQVEAIIELANGKKWFLGVDNARYLITGNTVTVL